MPTLHVCVITGQPMANLIPILHMKPEVVVLATTDRMKEPAARFARLLNRLHLVSSENMIRKPGLPDHDIASIEAWSLQCLDEVASLFPQHEIHLNATGGNKLMTLAMAGVFRHFDNSRRIRIFYLDTEHDRIEWVEPSSQPPMPVPNVVSIDTGLRIHGKRLGACSSKQAGAMEGIRSRKSLTFWMARHAGALNELFGTLNYHFRVEKTPPLAPMRLNKAPHTIWRDAMQRMADRGLLLFGGGVAFQATSREAIDYLAGGWLEEYVWQVLSDQGLADVLWSLEVFEDAKGQEVAPNELDVVAVHRNRLVIIECKTATYTTVRDLRQVIYKLDSVGNIGGLFGQKWLVMARGIQGTKGLPEDLVRAARASRVAIVTPDMLGAFPKLVRAWKESLTLPAPASK